MTTSKFKVGDRVVVRVARGSICTIEKVKASTYHGADAYIYFGTTYDGCDWISVESAIKHAPEAAGGPEDCPEGIVTFVSTIPEGTVTHHATADRAALPFAPGVKPEKYAKRFASDWPTEPDWQGYRGARDFTAITVPDEVSIVRWVAKGGAR